MRDNFGCLILDWGIQNFMLLDGSKKAVILNQLW